MLPGTCGREGGEGRDEIGGRTEIGTGTGTGTEMGTGTGTEMGMGTGKGRGGRTGRGTKGEVEEGEDCTNILSFACLVLFSPTTGNGGVIISEGELTDNFGKEEIFGSNGTGPNEFESLGKLLSDFSGTDKERGEFCEEEFIFNEFFSSREVHDSTEVFR
jgi:hypothetical protein